MYLIIKMFVNNSLILLLDKVMLSSIIIFLSMIFLSKVRKEDCYILKDNYVARKAGSYNDCT